MCGRFVNSQKIEVQARRFRAQPTVSDDAWAPTYNARPTQKLPVVIQDASRRLGLMRWGWKESFGPLINARGEEAVGKRTFAEALHRRRCLVPATAFYEWTPRVGRERGHPSAFRLRDGALFGIGGLWRKSQAVAEPGAPTAAPPLAEFVILTTIANPVVASVHERMAFMVPLASEDLWLDPATPIAQVLSLIAPLPAELLLGYRVSDRVSKPGTDGPELLEAAEAVQPP